MRIRVTRWFATLCCSLLVTLGCNLWAQTGEEFGDARIVQLLASYSKQTAENKAKYAALSQRWESNDTTITVQELAFLRCYYTTLPDYNPLEIDKRGKEIYGLNEDKKYEKAVKQCEELQTLCPYTLISYKEKAYALEKLGRDTTTVWARTQQIAQAISTYGEAFNPKDDNMVTTLNIPIFPLSLYEGALFYDMSASFPMVMDVVQLDKDLVVAYYSADTAGQWAFLSSVWGYFGHATRFYQDILDKNKQQIEAQSEEDLWESCSRSFTTNEPCNLYLEQYPKGKHAAEAKKRRDENILRMKEEQAFKKALSLQTQSSVDEYFTAYPLGVYKKPLELMLSTQRGTIIDDRDGQEYHWVKIGEQTWLAQNLNYNSPKSRCYTGEVFVDFSNADTSNNCVDGRDENYGRLYLWDEAQTACPTGWRLPNDSDWEKLASSIEWETPCNCEKSKWVGKEWVSIPNPTENKSYLMLQDSTQWEDGNNATGFSAIPTYMSTVSWLSASPSWTNDFGYEYVGTWELSGIDFKKSGDVKNSRFLVRCIKKD